MKLRKSALNVAVSPVISRALLALSRGSVRQTLDAAGDITAAVDNSGGVDQGYELPAVELQLEKGVADGANLVARDEFNTSIGQVNDALSVLAEHLNDNGLDVVGADVIGEGDGTITLSGTVAAIDDVMTASDGAADAAMLRTEMNAALVRARNNVAVVAAAYNTLAYAIGTQELVDGSKGSVGTATGMQNKVTADTAVTTANLGTTDVALKSYADAALGALADCVATLAAKINSDIFAVGTRALDGDSVVIVTR